MLKQSLSLLLAALATAAPAANQPATDSETILNQAALPYVEDLRTTTATVTNIEYNRGYTTRVFATPDGNSWAICDELNPEATYLVVFDTMGTETILDDEVAAMIPVGN